MAGSPDIALVSPGTTFGWRYADAALVRHMGSAGASCRVIGVPLGRAARLRRSMATTDLVEALAARHAARGVSAGAVIYSTFTAALLQPPRERTAIRFDGPPSVNRPGVGGLWQRRLEPEVADRASLLLPWSPGFDLGDRPALPCPPPVAVAPAAAADAPDVVAYAANPHKRGLEVLCAAWEAARPAPDATLGIAGLAEAEGRRWLAKLGGREPAGVRWLGPLERERWLTLVAGARAFLSAARIEDWGMAQMEALAAGTPLVCAPAPGGYAALPLARELAPELVAAERSAPALGGALAAALALGEAERVDYARRAEVLLEPYSDDAVARRVADELLPRLLGSAA